MIASSPARGAPQEVHPGDPGYDEARRDDNQRIDLHPDLIAYCASADDVASVVRQTSDLGKPIAVRSGGHDYEGFSLNEHGIVIDVSRCADIRLKADGVRAVIGAGATIGAIYRELAKSGRTIPAGTCPDVGISGLATGGGYGMLVRRHGLTSDLMRDLTFVDAAGRVRSASTDEDGDDLLWSARGGGGGSFGVVTDFDFETIAAPEAVVYFLVKWHWDPSVVETICTRWMQWVDEERRDFTSSLTLQGGSGKVMRVAGMFLGSEHDLTPLIDALCQDTKPFEHVVQAATYLDAMDFFAGPPSPRQPWKKKSSFGESAMTTAGIADAIVAVESAPRSATCVLSFDTFGGAVNDVAADATAFPHRTMRYLLQYQSYWNSGAPDADALAWVRTAFASLDPHTAQRSYRNYCDLDLADWQRRYFDGNYQRLQSIKLRLDPQDRFHHPQSIELPTGAPPRGSGR